MKHSVYLKFDSNSEVFQINDVRPKILFMTENYPRNMFSVKDNTYLYRKLLHPNVEYPLGTNQLLNNLSVALGLPLLPNESQRLEEFMQRYSILDTYMHNTVWTTLTPTSCGCGCNGLRRCVVQIIDKINMLKPEQIVFCYKRSNKRLYKRIVAGLNPSIRVVNPVDVYGTRIDDVFVSPTGQWFHDQGICPGFRTQISRAILHGFLLP